ncbi:unnamed protein product [Mytilus edulis]|uniref:PiggyBac transposable element-derived protein domain-containing protein n=1 Tax=Mytilus edulis TaxID=6550 RepID=A0A8S3VR46_MYTED|nr:unnamed protein product [Mytilus edulis]
MTCNDKFPANGGQIIQEYARSKGINTIKFKSKVYKNQRAYFRRVRRAKKVVTVSRTKISLPTPRQSSHLKKDIKVKIASGDLYLGEEIAPKDIISTTITDGKLQQKTTVIHGRKFPLVRLRRIALQEQVSSGVLRYFSDQEYDSLTMDQLTSRYIRIGQKPPAGTLSDKIEHLKLTERTRKIKLWHDHSCILNHSYVCFTISWLYDPANYFTDTEYQEKYKDRKPIVFKVYIEKPKLYIFGQSGSSDVEQSSYTAVRIEDLQILSEPITADNGNIKIFDVMRVFSGDGPARQFEIGPQRGPRNRTRKDVLEIYEEFQKTPVTVNQKPYATTQYANQCQTTENPTRHARSNEWSPVSYAEMRAFIGLVLAMGIVKKTSIESYWEASGISETPNFRDVMSRNRFQAILRHGRHC